MHSFITAARPIILDTLGVLFFAGLLALGATPATAAAVGIAITAGHIGFLLLTGRPVAALQRTVLALVLGSALATVVRGDPRFVMAKATVVYFAIALALLKRGWMLRYVPAHVASEVRDLTTGFGYAWAAMMFATGVANAIIAYWFTDWWPLFVSVVPLASKTVLFLIQFFATRVLYRRRTRATDVADGEGSEASPTAAEQSFYFVATPA